MVKAAAKKRGYPKKAVAKVAPKAKKANDATVANSATNANDSNSDQTCRN
jgi:hypothetical protein